MRAPTIDRRTPPRSTHSRYAVRLLAASLGALGVFSALVAAGQRGGDTFFSNLWLTVPFLAAALAGLGGGTAATLAIVKDRDRSLGVVVALVWGLIVLFFTGGELIFPH